MTTGSSRPSWRDCPLGVVLVLRMFETCKDSLVPPVADCTVFYSVDGAAPNAAVVRSIGSSSFRELRTRR